MTEIYLHLLFAHYGLYGNAPVAVERVRTVGRTTVIAHSLLFAVVRSSCCLSMRKDEPRTLTSPVGHRCPYRRVAGFLHSKLLPAKVRGTVSEELYHVTDWLPTLVALAGGSTARNFALDGHDLWPSLSTGTSSPRTEMLYHLREEIHRW